MRSPNRGRPGARTRGQTYFLDRDRNKEGIYYFSQFGHFENTAPKCAPEVMLKPGIGDGCILM